MYLNNKNRILIINDKIDISFLPMCKDAKLIYIDGVGALKSSTKSVDDSYYGTRYLTQITLNDIPLVQINAPSCPTCKSLLATGFGIDKANAHELAKISKGINSEFVDLQNSIEDLEPLLSLLESGLYIVADILCYPTDGDGHFFWNVSNTLTESSATAGVLLPKDDYNFVDGEPVFLYPTENTSCFNEERVRYYINTIKNSISPPRAIVYNFKEFMSFIIDGHHKACAAAILGKAVNCISIIPFSGYRYKNIGNEMVVDSLYFSTIELNIDYIPAKYLPPIPKQGSFVSENSVQFCEGKIANQSWPQKYLDSSKYYPTVVEYADMVSSGVYDFSDEMIAECLENLNNENQQRMKTILFFLCNSNDSRLKKTALICAKKLDDCKLKVQAYKVLSDIKDDPEVEQLFIDYLVENDSKHSILRSIANSYWDS